MIRNVRTHVNQNEPLIFELSSPGKTGYQLPELDVPAVDAAGALGAENVRAEIADFPEVSEVEAIRHFTRLSTWNYAIDLGMYPLGSCTMKYNPRMNELVARMEGLAWAHPYQPQQLSQGAMEVMARLEAALLRNHGHGRGDAPARGGRAWRTDRNPAGSRAARIARQRAEEDSGSRFGARHQSRHGGDRGIRRWKTSDRTSGACSIWSSWRGSVNEDVAALMVTNPNTLGVFEPNIAQDRGNPAREGRACSIWTART